MLLIGSSVKGCSVTLGKALKVRSLDDENQIRALVEQRPAQ